MEILTSVAEQEQQFTEKHNKMSNEYRALFKISRKDKVFRIFLDLLFKVSDS